MTINGINFSTLDTTKASMIINNKGNNRRYLMGVNNVSAEQGDPIDTVINSVEIDWNGAVLPDSGLLINPTDTNVTYKVNSTSDLLTLINEMQKEIYVLSAAVIALTQSI